MPFAHFLTELYFDVAIEFLEVFMSLYINLVSVTDLENFPLVLSVASSVC